MQSHNSLQKVASSSPEVIDIEDDESNTNTIAYMNEPLEDADTSSTMETTQDTLEDDKSPIKSGVENLKQQKIYDKNVENNDEKTKLQRIKLEDVQNLDILLPNEEKYTLVERSKKWFYSGLISYRKLINRIKPVFMERDAPEHKLKIVRWLTSKIEERGGRFLRQAGVDSNIICVLMTTRNSLEYTMKAFEDEKPWTWIEGNEENEETVAQSLLTRSLARPYEHDINVTCNVQSLSHPQTIPYASTRTDTLGTDFAAFTTDILKSAFSENFTYVNLSSEPLFKKLKPTATLPLYPSWSSNLQDLSKQNALEKVREDTPGQNSSLVLQNCLRERQIIRGELVKHQEVLLMRQNRLSRIEAEFRIFQDRQIFLPPEQWLTEKILRQEEILENRELLGIQQQRCRRLRTLLDLNDRQIFVQQTFIGKERSEHQNLQSLTQQRLLIDLGIEGKAMNGKIASRDTASTISNMNNLVDKENKKNSVRPVIKANMEKHHLDAQRVIDQHLAVETEINRRAALEQNLAMDQEVQYREAMEHAMNRQATMQHAMEVRQLMMSRAELSHHLSEIICREVPKSSCGTQKAIFDVTESVGDANNTKKITEIADEKDFLANRVILATRRENDDGYAEETDDDSIVI